MATAWRGPGRRGVNPVSISSALPSGNSATSTRWTSQTAGAPVSTVWHQPEGGQVGALADPAVTERTEMISRMMRMGNPMAP